MKTFLRTCIILISLAITTIVFSDYNPTLSTRLCQNINFCNTAKNNVTSTSPQIIYTTGMKVYDEIWFNPNNPDEMKYFYELKNK